MYDEFGAEYDRFVNWDSRLRAELPFLVRQLRSAGATRVLDTGCGTGMHAVALARKGFDVVAADASRTMVGAVRRNGERAGVSITAVEASFGEHAALAGGRFDAVLCLGNSLPHVLAEADLHAALADFRQCLRPGGITLIQSRNFDGVLATGERWMSPQGHTNEGGVERIYVRFYDFEAGGLLTFNIVTLRREPGSQWTQAPTSTLLWPQRRTDVEGGLRAAGIMEIDWYGDLQGNPYDPLRSPNLVAVGKL